MIKFLLLLLTISTTSIFAQNNNDECKIGICIVLQQCGELYGNPGIQRDANYYNLLRERTCGFDRRNPKVCCVVNNNNNNDDSTQSYNNKINPTTSSNNYPDSKKTKETQLLPIDCGKDLSNRIVGGNVTDIDEFPWMALLEYRTPKGRRTACGGVLISRRYVLTAAHCLKSSAIPTSWSLTSVRLGEYNTATNPDCITQGDDADKICTDEPISLGIEQQIVHENYEGRLANSNEHSDIALIRLTRDVNFTAFIKPVCLPTNNVVVTDENNNNNNIKKLTVAGWGKTELNSDSDVKLKVSLPLTRQSYCAQIYNQRKIDESQFCAGGEKGKDSCTGDSGGPIMQQSRNPLDQTMRWETVGIVSYGPTPCGTQGWPGVYTNVYYFKDWILSKLKP